MIVATESSLYQFISFELINTKTKKKREETALDLYSFMKGIWRVIEHQNTEKRRSYLRNTYPNSFNRSVKVGF